MLHHTTPSSQTLYLGWLVEFVFCICIVFLIVSILYLWIIKHRSLGALRAPTSRWRPFGPLDFVLRALRVLRPCDPRKHLTHQRQTSNTPDAANGSHIHHWPAGESERELPMMMSGICWPSICQVSESHLSSEGEQTPIFCDEERTDRGGGGIGHSSSWILSCFKQWCGQMIHRWFCLVLVVGISSDWLSVAYIIKCGRECQPLLQNLNFTFQ